MSGSRRSDSDARNTVRIRCDDLRPRGSTKPQAISARFRFCSATPRLKTRSDIWVSISKMPYSWLKEPKSDLGAACPLVDRSLSNGTAMRLIDGRSACRPAPPKSAVCYRSRWWTGRSTLGKFCPAYYPTCARDSAVSHWHALAGVVRSLRSQDFIASDLLCSIMKSPIIFRLACCYSLYCGLAVCLASCNRYA